MKKYFLLFVLCTTLLLSSCKKITSDSFDDVTIGSSEGYSIETLGKPNRIISDSSDLLSEINDEVQTYEHLLSLVEGEEDSEEYILWKSEIEQVYIVRNLIKNNKEVVIYQYEYLDENADGKTSDFKQNLYFYNEKLILK